MSVSFFNLSPSTERWRTEDPFYLTDNGGMAFSRSMRTRGYILKEEDIIHLENVP